MRTRCSYIENDSVTYQIDITILDDNSLSIELKISFNVKKRVESFKPLFLDCMTTKRIDYIRINNKKIETSHHDYGRILLPSDSLKMGKNVFESKIVTSNAEEIGFFNRQNCVFAKNYPFGYSTIFPCFDQPS